MTSNPTVQHKADFLIITTPGQQFVATVKSLSRPGRRVPIDNSEWEVFDLPISLADGSRSAYRIVIVQTEIGIVSAAITASNAIRAWNPRYVILTGLAGGVRRSKVAVGDILIADQIVSYEQKKITSEGIQARWEVYRADSRLLECAHRLADRAWVKLIRVKRPGGGRIKVHTGAIASGNTIFASSEAVEKLQEHWERLIGVEMEAAGVGAAISNIRESPGFFLIRGVAELSGDASKDVNFEKWQQYSSAAAAAFTVGLLTSAPVEPLPHRESQIDIEERGIRVFCSYSHRDEKLRQELETQLRLLRRSGVIHRWFDRDIDAGDDWRSQINSKLEQADIFLVLLSPDFLASDYCYDVEMRRALELHSLGEVLLMPVLLRDVDVKESPFSKLQLLPRDGRPITSWKDRDTAWRSVSEGIEKIVAQIRGAPSSLTKAPLLLSELALENIRCFQNLKLSLSSDPAVRNFVLLFGDNGVGKTTLLRCIALGLCDETTATGLIEMLPGTLLRENCSRGSIRVTLVSSEDDKTWTAETILRRKRNGEVVVEQVAPDDFPRERVFACGYGAGRRGFGTQDYTDFALKNSLATLFNYDLSLQNPELALRRIEARSISIRDVTQTIDTVLMLEPGSTRIDSSGITIKGPWGEFKPLGGLGDGFQATLGWIADLIGWAFFFSSESIKSGPSGIVLLDELEQHLHPSWQREIIRLLRHQFPRVQFLATSHSPMCALGTTALPISETEIVRLRQGDNCVEATQLFVPKNQRADQVLTSPLFGLFSASGFDVAANMERFTQLAAKDNRSNAEEFEYLELEEHLEKIIGPFRSDLERRIYEHVREAMNKELEDALTSGKLASDALDLKIRYRIRNFPDGGNSD